MFLFYYSLAFFFCCLAIVPFTSLLAFLTAVGLLTLLGAVCLTSCLWVKGCQAAASPAFGAILLSNRGLDFRGLHSFRDLQMSCPWPPASSPCRTPAKLTRLPLRAKNGTSSLMTTGRGYGMVLTRPKAPQKCPQMSWELMCQGLYS